MPFRSLVLSRTLGSAARLAGLVSVFTSMALSTFAQSPNISEIWVGKLGDADNPNEIYYHFVTASDGAITPYFSAPIYGEKYMNAPFPKFSLKGASLSFPSFEGAYDSESDTIRGKVQFGPEPADVTLARTNSIKAPETDRSEPSTAKPAWVFSSGAAIWSSPLVSDNTLYIGNDGGSLLALEPRSGTLKWKFKTAGMIRCQPLAYRNLICFTSDDGFLYAVTTGGELRWKFDLHGQSFQRRLPHSKGATWDYAQSSPYLSGDEIYIGSSDRCVYAIDAASGKERWHYPTDHMIRATPVVNGNVVYVGNWSGKLYALERGTGKSLWVFDAKMPIVAQPAITHSNVLFGSRSGFVWCLEGKTGKEAWKRNYWWSWVESSATAEGDVAYVGSSDLRQVLALNVHTGKKIWQRATAGYPWGKPVIDGQNLYIGTVESNIDRVKSGVFYVLSKESGSIQCKIAPPADEAQFLNGVYSSAAYTPELIIFGSANGNLYAYHKRDVHPPLEKEPRN